MQRKLFLIPQLVRCRSAWWQLLTLLALVIGVLLPGHAAHAQSDPQVKPIASGIIATPTGPTLVGYLWVVGPNGEAFKREDVELAHLQLPGAAEQPITLQDPDTPISIALLIDASGSMSDHMAQVRAAAEKAVNAAPKGARIAVYRFSRVELTETMKPAVDFTTNRTLINTTIEAIEPEPNGETCIDNAAFQVITQLQAAAPNPQDRRALLLFTDGADEAHTRKRCSSRSIENVVALAGTNPKTPIFSIGLCKNASCPAAQAQALQQFSDRTDALALLRPLDGLDAAFQTVMDRLKAQIMFQTPVCLPAGDHTATLTLKPKSGEQDLHAVFPFSIKDTCLPAATIIASNQYLPEQDQFLLKLRITNPQSVPRLDITVRKKDDSDIQTFTHAVAISDAVTGEHIESFEVPKLAQPYVFGQSYCFEIRANGDQPHPSPTGNNQSQNDTSLLAQTCADYKPNIAIEIGPVQPDAQQQNIIIKLLVNGDAGRTLSFGVELGQANSELQTFGPLIVDSNHQIQVPLPAALQRATIAQQYDLTLRPTIDRQPLPALHKQITLPPIKDNGSSVTPIILSAIGLMIAALLGWLLYQQRRQRQPAIPPSRVYSTVGGAPSVAPTPVAATPAPPAALRIRVLNTLDPRQQREELVTELPCVIGRKGQFVISGDRAISREHVEVGLHGGIITVRDLEAANGTEVDGKRLEQNASVSTSRRVQVALGPHTRIEIEAR